MARAARRDARWRWHLPCKPFFLGEPASLPALPAEHLPADVRRDRDLRGGPPPLVGGQPAPPEPHALPRARHDAAPLQGEGLRLSPLAAPARRPPACVRVDGCAR